MWTVSGGLPVLDEAAAQALVEVVAAESGRIAALLAGDLPLTLVEHAEEAGVELLPFGGELEATCTCDAWLDPVPARARRAVPADLAGRGRPVRAAARCADSAATRCSPGCTTLAATPARRRRRPDLELALDAALRAARMLELVDDPASPIDHLW